ncbi:LOW QUALITY PROTEIN: bcl-2-like protein 12 [Macrochelys suwanniensis]
MGPAGSSSVRLAWSRLLLDPPGRAMARPPSSAAGCRRRPGWCSRPSCRGRWAGGPPGARGGQLHDPHCYAHSGCCSDGPAPARIPPAPRPPGQSPAKDRRRGGRGAPSTAGGSPLRVRCGGRAPPREETEPPPPPSAPPNSLPVTPCYCRDTLTAQPDPPPLGRGAEDPEFYSRVARKLDRLVQQQRSGPGSPSGVRSPGVVAGPLRPELGPGPPAPPEPASETHKEQVIQRLVTLLEEQAGVINQEIEADPLLRSSLSRLSYRSFWLAEAYTARGPSQPQPQLTQLALTMELTRKVVGINSHTVQTLMGYSLQYMDMFVPWLQQQGGWESIAGQDEILTSWTRSPWPWGARGGGGAHNASPSPFPPQNPPYREGSEPSHGGGGAETEPALPNSQGEWRGGSLEESAPQNL